MKKRLRYLSSKEYSDILDIVEILRDKLIISFLFETGCTVSELVDVRVKHVNTDENKVSIPAEKGAARTSLISEELKKDIVKFISRRKKKGDDYLFSSRESKI